MNSIHQQRCFHHGFREAVAKCPSCEQFFCRECITEHDDRMICASCLKKQVQPMKAGRRSVRIALHAVQAVCGFMIIWTVFFFIGQILLEVETDVHEGTLWREEWLGLQ